MRAKMKIRNRQLGDVEVGPGSIVDVPEGLVGFEDQKRFCLIDRGEDRPFFWLVSVDEPELCFAVVDPEPFIEGPYEVVLNEADRTDLGLDEGDSVQVLVIASPGERSGQVTLNLKGPLVLNPRNRLMRQLLVYSNKLPLRYPIDAAILTENRHASRFTTVRVVGKRAA